MSEKGKLFQVKLNFESHCFSQPFWLCEENTPSLNNAYAPLTFYLLWVGYPVRGYKSF